MGSCLQCGAALTGRQRDWCREACRLKAYRARTGRLPFYAPRSAIGITRCIYCAELYIVRRGRRATDCCCRRDVCRRAQAAARMRRGGWTKSRRRARRRGLKIDRFTDLDIFERDGWRCGICREPVDRIARFPHADSASLDHVIPLSQHGEHSRANVRCAHLRCNQKRGTRGDPVQLALIG